MSARSARMIDSPSFPGNIRSTMATSTPACRASSLPASPVRAQDTTCPSCFRPWLTKLPIFSSSSMSTMCMPSAFRLGSPNARVLPGSLAARRAGVHPCAVLARGRSPANAPRRSAWRDPVAGPTRSSASGRPRARSGPVSVAHGMGVGQRIEPEASPGPARLGPRRDFRLDPHLHLVEDDVYGERSLCEVSAAALATGSTSVI